MFRGMVVCRPLLVAVPRMLVLPAPLVTVMFVGSPVVKQKLQAHEDICSVNAQGSRFAFYTSHLSSMQWFRQLFMIALLKETATAAAGSWLGHLALACAE